MVTTTPAREAAELLFEKGQRDQRHDQRIWFEVQIRSGRSIDDSADDPPNKDVSRGRRRASREEDWPYLQHQRSGAEILAHPNPKRIEQSRLLRIPSVFADRDGNRPLKFVRVFCDAR